MRRKFSSLIAIAGDSWGCGEWAPPDQGFIVTHTGLQKHFEDAGLQVLNASKGFIGNAEALNLLQDKLTPAVKTIVWFVTCALRGTSKTIDQDPYEYGLQCLKDNMRRAELIAKNQQANFFVIGGLCDIPDDFAQCFPGLRFIVPSSCSLFIENYPRSIFGDVTAAQGITNKNLAGKITNLVGSKHDLFQSSEWFPDNYHLGRQAYYKLFKLLLPYVQSKI
jgi:hypothetical protein